MTDTYLNYFRVIVSQFVQFRGSKRNKNVKDKKESKLTCYKFGIPAGTQPKPKHNDALALL